MKVRSSLLVVLVIGSAITMASRTAFAEAYLYEVLAKPAYLKSWNALILGEENVDDWLAHYAKTKNGPAGAGIGVKLGTTRYQINSVCKTHDCGNNQFFVLFSANGAKAWGLLLTNMKGERFFGNPDEEKRQALRTAAHQ